MSIDLLEKIVGRRIVDIEMKVFKLESFSDISFVRIRSDCGIDLKIECSSEDEYVRVVEWTLDDGDVVDDFDFGKLYFTHVHNDVDLNKYKNKIFISYISDGFVLKLMFSEDLKIDICNFGDKLQIST